MNRPSLAQALAVLVAIAVCAWLAVALQRCASGDTRDYCYLGCIELGQVSYFEPGTFGAVQRLSRDSQSGVDVPQADHANDCCSNRGPRLDGGGPSYSSFILRCASIAKDWRWLRRALGWSLVAAGARMFFIAHLRFILTGRRFLLLTAAAMFSTQLGTSLLLLDVVDLELLAGRSMIAPDRQAEVGSATCRQLNRTGDGRSPRSGLA